MAALYLIEMLMFGLIVYFFFSQIIVPHLNGHHKFPYIRNFFNGAKKE